MQQVPIHIANDDIMEAKERADALRYLLLSLRCLQDICDDVKSILNNGLKHKLFSIAKIMKHGNELISGNDFN